MFCIGILVAVFDMWLGHDEENIKKTKQLLGIKDPSEDDYGNHEFVHDNRLDIHVVDGYSPHNEDDKN